MCGIAGFMGWEGRHDQADDRLRAMCGAIRHRGPDDEGRYVAPGVALGMRRLSIIDVSGGHQPIANEDGTIQVVFNGEIYNYRELRRDLERAGHRFSTKSDTEVLVHLYEEKGDDLVQDLAGMFGFALWDTSKRRLLVARDRIGIKPVYYWDDGDGLGFGSELRSLLAVADGMPDLDHTAILQYCAFGYIPDPLSVFSGVRKLPPGHTLSWTAEKGAEVRRYWTPVREQVPEIDADTAVEALQCLLSEAVGSHLESEVPLGAFLSGGIDSSAVVALMAKQMSRKVRTFSIGFEDPRFNEAPHAAAVAAALGTDHTEFMVRPDADSLVEQVVRAYDEPFADSSALPTYLVSQLARSHVTVALSGDGGDELFGGYTRYGEVVDRTALLGRHGVQRAVGGAARALPHAFPGRNRLLDLARNRRGRYATTVAAPLHREEGGLLRTDALHGIGPAEHRLDDWFDQTSGRDFLTQMTLVDMLTYLPGDILTKVDRATMANSLEARVPLLDHRVIEFAVSLPPALKLRDGTGKWLLREAIRGLVPDSVLTKPKAGFAVPLATWFRNDLKHRVEALLRADARIHEWVDRRALARVVREHRVGRRDHSGSLWRFMALDLWLGFLEGGELALPSEPDQVRDFIATR